MHFISIFFIFIRKSPAFFCFFKFSIHFYLKNEHFKLFNQIMFQVKILKLD